MHLDERLEAVAQGAKSVNESLEPLLQSAKTPTASQTQYSDTSEHADILRKHATMISEWVAVQKESQVLREELKEDKWLTVFRTVTEQADGMMSSLEKAINRCQVSSDWDATMRNDADCLQDFIFQVHKRGPDDSLSRATSGSSLRSEKSPLNPEVFNTLVDSFEAKKK